MSDFNKTITFIRHAEGIHNEAEIKAGTNDILLTTVDVENKYLDSYLNKKGIEQSINIKSKIKTDNIDLIISSPLTRTLETADYSLSSSVKEHIKFISTELCRELLGIHTPDGRSSIEKLKIKFPYVDFSLIKSNEDNLYKKIIEDEDSCYERAGRFLKWLLNRTEKTIIVYSHRHFLRNLSNYIIDNHKHKLKKEEIESLKNEFINCEIKTITL